MQPLSPAQAEAHPQGLPLPQTTRTGNLRPMKIRAPLPRIRQQSIP